MQTNCDKAVQNLAINPAASSGSEYNLALHFYSIVHTFASGIEHHIKMHGGFKDIPFSPGLHQWNYEVMEASLVRTSLKPR